MADEAAEPFDPRRPPLLGLWRKRHPIPDLARIPREHWMEVLRHTHPDAGRLAHRNLPGHQQIEAMLVATEAALTRPLPVTVAPEAVAYPPGLPGVGVAATAGADRKDRQVNFRLAPPVFRELEEAAQIVRMRPTALARLLVTRGVTQILQEAKSRG